MRLETVGVALFGRIEDSRNRADQVSSPGDNIEWKAILEGYDEEKATLFDTVVRDFVAKNYGTSFQLGTSIYTTITEGNIEYKCRPKFVGGQRPGASTFVKAHSFPVTGARSSHGKGKKDSWDAEEMKKRDLSVVSEAKGAPHPPVLLQRRAWRGNNESLEVEKRANGTLNKKTPNMHSGHCLGEKSKEEQHGSLEPRHLRKRGCLHSKSASPDREQGEPFQKPWNSGELNKDAEETAEREFQHHKGTISKDMDDGRESKCTTRAVRLVVV